MGCADEPARIASHARLVALNARNSDGARPKPLPMRRSSARFRLPAPPVRLEPSAAAWPAALCDLKESDRPSELFVAGELPAMAGAVAIVGTRRCSEAAVEFTQELAASIAARGAVVISGGAEGIDAAAHRGCLDVGGTTVAVLATGFARAYPSAHEGMFLEIAASGALACEWLDPEPIYRSMFLERNRLIAALAEAVVVVQAPERSGALSTARWARALGRRLYAVPAGPWDARSGGCLALLRSGAQICTSAKDVLSLPASAGSGAVSPAFGQAAETNDDEHLSATARDLWECLQRGPRYPDQLCVCLDMPAARVQEGLLTLLLLGRVRRRADGTYETKTRSR